MNDVLREILATRQVTVPGGARRKTVHSHVSEEEGNFLRDLIAQADPTVVVEIGLAYGVSALYMCDGLKVRENTRYLAIDPKQSGASWEGIGAANLERAGYGGFVEVIEQPSYQALPVLESRGVLADFAFVDGWHTFDYTLIDCFYLDRILRVGGILVLDDANWPAVRRVCRFIGTNLAYRVIGSAGNKASPSWKRAICERFLAKTPLRGCISPELLRTDRALGIDGSCVAFEKTGQDTRRWDHYEPF